MRVDRVSKWLARFSPTAHRAIRRPWCLIGPYLPVEDGYWLERRDFNYYAEVVRLSRTYVPDGGSVIDVGGGAAQLLQRLDGFEHRVALEPGRMRRQTGIEQVQGNFFAYQAARVFDLVLNLQGIEHLHAPAVFARKLFDTGRIVIISVPYRWPAGAHRPHVQDPVDEEKLASWTGRTPTETLVVRDKPERLISVYAP